MAGPGVGILLRAPLTEYQFQELITWLRSHTAEVIVTRPWNCEFLADGSPFANNTDKQHSENEHVHTYLLGVNEPPDLEHSESQQIAKAEGGFYPASELIVSVMSKGDAEHKTLAHISVFLAERFDGLINLGGCLSWRSDAVGKDKQSQIFDWVNIPGMLIEVNASTDGGSDTSYGEPSFHVVDALCMRSWIIHPNFCMIK